MEKIYIVVAETMGTDGEFYAETYPCRTDKEAYECACGLIADMAETMDCVEDVNPEKDWTLGNEEWWYRVKIETHEW